MVLCGDAQTGEGKKNGGWVAKAGPPRDQIGEVWEDFEGTRHCPHVHLPWHSSSSQKETKRWLLDKEFFQVVTNLNLSLKPHWKLSEDTLRCISNISPFPHQFREPLHVDEQWKLNPGKVLEEEKNIIQSFKFLSLFYLWCNPLCLLLDIGSIQIWELCHTKCLCSGFIIPMTFLYFERDKPLSRMEDLWSVAHLRINMQMAHCSGATRGHLGRTS